MSGQQHSPDIHKPRRILQIAAWTLLAVVIAIALTGYLGTDLQMQWESIAALCGF